MSSTLNILGTETATEFVGPLVGNSSNIALVGATAGDVVTATSGGQVQDSGILSTNLVTATSTIISGNIPEGNGSKGLSDSGVAIANVGVKSGSFVTNDLLVLNSGGAIIDSGILASTVGIKSGTITAGDFLTLNSSGDIVDSGFTNAVLNGNKNDIVVLDSLGNVTDSNCQIWNLIATTTSSTATNLLVNGTSNGIPIAATTAVSYRAQVTVFDTTSNISGAFFVNFVAQNISSVITVINGTIESLLPTGLSGCSIAIVADNTNLAAQIQVVGLASATCVWSAVVTAAVAT